MDTNFYYTSYIRGAATDEVEKSELLLLGIVFVLTTLNYISGHVHALVKWISWQTSDGFLCNYIIIVIIKTSHVFLSVHKTYPTINRQID
jgi:hypothetical protein